MALTAAPSRRDARSADLTVPLFATRPALEPLLPRIAERQRAVLDSGRYILGPEVEAFEAEFAAFVGRRHCIGVANGTESLTIALRALGVGPGDEVVVPGVSFFATAGAVVNARARPVFADIDPETHCITAATVEPVLTERTRAIVPVHLFGNPAPMAELMGLARSRDLALLEDAAQAAGAAYEGRRAGAHGDAASFSFYPGKNLGAVGDAGAIVTDDDDVAETARTLRVHGQREPWVHTEVGYNSRLDELQAAALRVLLPHLEGWTKARRDAARAYERAGIEELVQVQRETEGGASAYHLYVVRTQARDELAAGLRDAGVETRAYYTTPLNRQPAVVDGSSPDRLVSSERLASQGLALPMGQSLDEATATRVVDAIRALR
jgi:dTDP-4-amino-4,6-dideoxygalactose transaminase